MRLWCKSERYFVHRKYCMVMIFLYPIGIPLGYLTLLTRHRLLLSDEDKMIEEEARPRQRLSLDMDVEVLQEDAQ